MELRSLVRIWNQTLNFIQGERRRVMHMTTFKSAPNKYFLYFSFQQSMDLPPDKAKLLRSYDLDKKWDLICDQVSNHSSYRWRQSQTIVLVSFQELWLNLVLRAFVFVVFELWFEQFRRVCVKWWDFIYLFTQIRLIEWLSDVNFVDMSELSESTREWHGLKNS